MYCTIKLHLILTSSTNEFYLFEFCPTQMFTSLQKHKLAYFKSDFRQDLHCEYQVALCLAIWELSSIKWSVKFCM